MTPSPYARMRTQGWPWSPCTAVMDPELKYWLSRTEETCRRSPSLSTDLIRASNVEIKALVRSKQFNRWLAPTQLNYLHAVTQRIDQRS